MAGAWREISIRGLQPWVARSVVSIKANTWQFLNLEDGRLTTCRFSPNRFAFLPETCGL
jgi:hypothetical protein